MAMLLHQGQDTPRYTGVKGIEQYSRDYFVKATGINPTGAKQISVQGGPGLAKCKEKLL